MELSLGTYVVEGHTVLEVGGEVDVHTAPKLRERASELLDGGVGALIIATSATSIADEFLSSRPSTSWP